LHGLNAYLQEGGFWAEEAKRDGHVKSRVQTRLYSNYIPHF
jgi:hypothetical protein